MHIVPQHADHTHTHILKIYIFYILTKMFDISILII
jgi:hypothetical protein